MATVTTRITSERFRLEVHLGRDHDVDEWLGTDTLLDRPVLVRVLDPAAGRDRRAEFLRGVQAAARVSHVHLSAVYAADDAVEAAYAVQEWAGGITLADRLAAGDHLDTEEALRNGAGLAEALAALHDAGGRHGGIDASAVAYPAAQPAKLGAFGRMTGPGGPEDDVTDLARVIRQAVGADDAGTGARPGMPPAAVRALEAAGAGAATGAGLAAALRAAPIPRPRRVREWSWTWVAAALAILLAAVIVGVIGLALRVQPSGSPLLFPAPAAPSPQTTAPPATADPAPTTTDARDPATPPQLVAVAAYDPFGTGGERDGDVPLLHDGDQTTSWRTERYFDPLERIKEGVGVTFDVSGTPTRIIVTATPDTAFTVGWAAEVPAGFDAWEWHTDERTGTGDVAVRLPARDGGVWLLWLTELPTRPPEGYYYADLYEVRFE